VTDRHAAVALPLPVAEPYRYRIPPALADRALPGARVVVPVRQQEMLGIVTAVDVPPPTSAARDILGCPDPVPALSAELLALAERAARYYGAPPGMMLRAMLPAALWGKSQVRLQLMDGAPRGLGGTAGDLLDWLQRRAAPATMAQATRALKRPMWEAADRLHRIGAVALEVIPPPTDGGVVTTRTAVLVGEALPLLDRDRRFARAPKQRALYEVLEGRGGRLGVRALLEAAGSGDGPLRALEAAGVVRIVDEGAPRDPFGELPSSPPPDDLTPDQVAALERLRAVPIGEPALLFGVTGSGKTLVYLERIRELLAAGRGAILLVPEIALTPQTVARVRGMFGDEVAVLHSGLTDGERADAWRALRHGTRRVAVGARSAVFAPVADLGIIVLDEEHEATYKNGETPRYHARDIAAWRARLEGAALVLGSATPATETWARLAPAGRVIRLPARVGDRPLPPVALVDLRTAPQVPAAGGLPWTIELDDAVTTALARSEQVLLLLNRRGWAAFMQCTACGDVVQCPNCSISLTVHRHPEQLRCHYCDVQQPIPAQCPGCNGVTTRHLGAGTQQLERLLAERFPTARLARMDLDTTASKWGHHHILERVGRGEVDILLGTQMIAKGIDFPNVTLVGVVDADTALHLPDFRAAERTFQLVAQVAGRAGRGPRGGRVVVQTRQPEHPALQLAARHDAEGFLATELEARRSPAYPPHIGLVRVVASGEEAESVAARLAAFADWCEGVVAKAGLPIIVLGPAPCPIERIQGRFRHHLILKGPPQALGRWVRAVAPRLGTMRDGVRLAVDRDPVTLL
jgi:primosomal protein N' (replication factor Y)